VRNIAFLGIALICMIVGGFWVYTFDGDFVLIPVGVRLFGCVFITVFGLFGSAIIYDLSKDFDD
jgi:hypothetical protein